MEANKTIPSTQRYITAWLVFIPDTVPVVRILRLEMLSMTSTDKRDFETYSKNQSNTAIYSAKSESLVKQDWKYIYIYIIKYI